MKTHNHPDSGKLAAYLDNPESADSLNITDHLISCSACRTRLNSLVYIQDEISNNGQILFSDTKPAEGQAMTTDFNEQLIGRFVDDQLSDKDRHYVEDVVANNPQAMKMALYYASQRSAAKQQVAAVGVWTRISNFVSPFFSAIVNYRLPAWIVLPASVVASALIIFNFSLNIEHNSESTLTIAAYQDNAVMQFNDKSQQPGMGFFSSVLETVKPYNNIAISFVTPSTLVLRWDAVKRAKVYNIRLTMFENGQEILVGESSLSLNSVNFENINSTNSHRFKWALTGQTTDEKIFYSSGGFVINPVIH